MKLDDTGLLRASLILVWLLTGAASLVELNGQSSALLQQAGLVKSAWREALIVGGALVDIALGLALWLRPGRLVYAAALIGMLAMTLIATLLLPALWLHPLGPLLKNLPIAAVLVVLWRRAE